ncbi:biotin-dependent carboxyltransferase family protein [Hyunsoonleella sp. 2307UL5-6]|uniref:5-oxoprolinase subunit C family protein n=1 Tax=Hyunsoonleella sp. 2307UL5-6 TaxID=3384768 RepID=UPI0039BD704E
MIKVLKAGFYTTIQDLGRVGCQQYGVPLSGVMDKRAAILANTLVGNTANAAVLEITMSGPHLQFECNSAIAITGANMSPVLHHKRIGNNRYISVSKGDILSFGALQSGFRCYLAISGGFKTQKILGSKSMFKGITKSYSITKNTTLTISQNSKIQQEHFAGVKIDDSYVKAKTLEVFPGIEFDMLSKTQKQKLFSESFSISKDNNRMAYQLNETIENALEGIITSPVLPGTVQLTPSGKLIVLMRDCQTTGGYPRVMQLTENAISSLSQKFVGEKIVFKLKN